LREGDASELWGIDVAKGYSDTEGEGPPTMVGSASLHWIDCGELVCFARSSTDSRGVLVEEMEWVVGEVLAWLEQVDLPAW
jgi:hypothetical protein